YMTSLVFYFRTDENLLQLAVTIAETGCLFLTLDKKFLERTVESDGPIDLGARTRAADAEQNCENTGDGALPDIKPARTEHTAKNLDIKFCDLLCKCFQVSVARTSKS